MAKIRKRGKSYQIDYFDPTGKRIRKSFKKKKDAEAELGKLVSLIAEGCYLDVKKEYTTTLKELVDKYTENFKHQDSFKTGKEHYLETYRNHLKQKITKNKTIRSDASVNREMSCLHHIFTKAVEWEMIDRSPFDKGKSLILKENNKRLRFLSKDEIKNLLDNCSPYLHKIVNCALNTGMRRVEILNLKWNQVRDGFIYLKETKTNEPRQIPINETLEDMFKQIKSEQNPKGNKVIGLDGNPVKLNSEYVFTIKDKPIKEVKRPLKRLSAIQESKISDFMI